MTKRKNTTRMLCEGAFMIALSLVLGLFKVFELPQGGSISLEMLPLLFFCVRWGVGSALRLSGLRYSAGFCTGTGLLGLGFHPVGTTWWPLLLSA